MPATNGIKVRAECSSKSYCRTTETNDVITLVFKYLYIIHVIKRRLKQINCICRLVCKFNPRGKRGFRLRFKIKSWCYFTFCINEVLDWFFGLKPKSKTLVLVKDEVTQQSKSYTNIKALTFPEACTSTVRLIAAWIEVGMLWDMAVVNIRDIKHTLSHSNTGCEQTHSWQNRLPSICTGADLRLQLMLAVFFERFNAACWVFGHQQRIQL